MICDGCGNEHAHSIQVAWSKRDGRRCQCDRCGAVTRGVPDVYFKGEYVDENIASEQYPGPKLIRSRQDKKMWLQKCNLREAGDPVHGMSRFDPISHRHAMESLKTKRR